MSYRKKRTGRKNALSKGTSLKLCMTALLTVSLQAHAENVGTVVGWTDDTEGFGAIVHEDGSITSISGLQDDGNLEHVSRNSSGISLLTGYQYNGSDDDGYYAFVSPSGEIIRSGQIQATGGNDDLNLFQEV